MYRLDLLFCEYETLNAVGMLQVTFLSDIMSHDTCVMFRGNLLHASAIVIVLVCEVG